MSIIHNITLNKQTKQVLLLQEASLKIAHWAGVLRVKIIFNEFDDSGDFVVAVSAVLVIVITIVINGADCVKDNKDISL